MTFYQYIIYNYDFMNEETGEPSIQETSNLYTSKDKCERAALDCIEEICNDNECDSNEQDTWKYEVVELSIVD